MYGGVRSLVLGVSLGLIAACATTPPVLQGSIKAEPTSNPDGRGRPSPIVIRVYELRALGAFTSADFFSLFEKETETLGVELVGREEYTVRPSETKPYQRQLQADTKFIGVVAAFRDLENSRWRQTAPVPTSREITITVGVDKHAVSMALK
jgi:type VI secretion system protein VasD